MLLSDVPTNDIEFYIEFTVSSKEKECSALPFILSRTSTMITP